MKKLTYKNNKKGTSMKRVNIQLNSIDYSQAYLFCNNQSFNTAHLFGLIEIKQHQFINPANCDKIIWRNISTNSEPITQLFKIGSANILVINYYKDIRPLNNNPIRVDNTYYFDNLLNYNS